MLDIAYLVQTLSQFMNKLALLHLTTAQIGLKYLKSIVGQGIFQSASSECHLKAFSDSNWTACVNTLRSITNYCVFLGDLIVSLKSKKPS